jgi:hypothetical protein
MDATVKKLTIVAWLFGLTVLVTFILRVSLLSRSSPLRACGHERNALNELNPFRATHCCHAGKLIGDLDSIHFAERIHMKEHGVLATHLTELTNEFGLGVSKTSRLYAISIVTNGSDWSLVVPRTEYLPGHYLMTSDGSLYFRKDAPASTNDTCLSHFR